jgi:sterol desaturase/sphingolipid hydroxylase (fatty acid hydroxylase superfamily)
MTDGRANEGLDRKALDLPLTSPFDGNMSLSPSRRDRVRLFGSPALEALTVISLRSFVVVWAIMLPLIATIAFHLAPTLLAPLLIAAGLAVWSFSEYALHRFVFHFEGRSLWMERFVFVIHGNHHAYPNDPLRNLMPPVVSFPIAALVAASFIGALGLMGAWMFFGFMVGYVTYDLVHYACHQLPMKGRLARVLKNHHMRHHHLKDEGNYAITGMIWDRMLSTRISAVKEKA